VRGFPIPKILVPLWNLSAANAPRAQKIRQQMKADGWLDFETTNYYVVREIAPALLNPKFIHKPFAKYPEDL
jgi:hypothetical protein